LSDQDFIPYLILVRFDKDDDLKSRVRESLPVLHSALSELGAVEPVMSAYDGSMVAYLLEAGAELQPARILERLHSAASRRVSPLTGQDKVLVVTLECGVAVRMERITEWLSGHGCLA
jgi:hypothetical protein